MAKKQSPIRGPHARKPITLLVSDEERALLETALATENHERDVPIGLGTKLRLLGLAWAEEIRPGRYEQINKGGA